MNLMRPVGPSWASFRPDFVWKKTTATSSDVAKLQGK